MRAWQGAPINGPTRPEKFNFVEAGASLLILPSVFSSLCDMPKYA